MGRKRDTGRAAEALADLIWELGARGLDGVCCADLSLVEFHTLRQLQVAGHLSVQAVGEATGLTKSGATRLVDRLQQRGFLTRMRSEADGRVCCVAPTPAGETALDQARRAFSGRLAALLAGLAAGERDQLLAVLPRLAGAARRGTGPACCGPSA